MYTPQEKKKTITKGKGKKNDTIKSLLKATKTNYDFRQTIRIPYQVPSLKSWSSVLFITMYLHAYVYTYTLTKTLLHVFSYMYLG